MNSEKSLPVAIDAMGGDLGPGVVVEGVVRAVRELSASCILVGRTEEIENKLKELGAESDSRISIVDAPDVITMEDSPATAIRRKARASIRVAFELVRDGKASGVISPGNTGAVMAAGLFIVGSIPGIARPAIATLIPRKGVLPPTVLLDSGANVDCHAHQLAQFALMGQIYAASVMNREHVRVALLSNGEEASKGNDIARSAAMILRDMPEINYVGYVEGRDIPRDKADVIVCDGFVGNIVLKSMEGTVELVMDSIKHYVQSSTRGKIGMWLAKPVLKKLFTERLDPSAYGGAPLLGLNALTIICHGSSNSKAIFNAVRVAKKFVDEDIMSRLKQSLSVFDPEIPLGNVQDAVWNRMGMSFDKKQDTAKKKKAVPTDSTNSELSEADGKSQEKVAPE